MFTWAMDHGYEIIALAAQPPEPKHAKCINADKNRMPGTNHQCNKRSWNDISQLILWIYLHQANRYELRPAIPVQPSELKCTNNMIYYSETVEFYTRFWNDISQLILWIYLHWGLGYELRPTIPIQPSEQKWRNQFDLSLRNGWILHKVLKSYLPAHSVDLSSQRPIDMILDPPILQNPLNQNEEPNLT